MPRRFSRRGHAVVTLTAQPKHRGMIGGRDGPTIGHVAVITGVVGRDMSRGFTRGHGTIVTNTAGAGCSFKYGVKVTRFTFNTLVFAG